MKQPNESGAGTDRRIVYLDLLRIAATFLVIMIHASAETWRQAAAGSLNWHAANLYNSLSRCAVPVFVMISGSLLLSRELSIGTVLRKYVLRMARVFLFWSLAYALYSHAWRSFTGFRAIVTAWGLGESHLWFLYMIAGLYLVTPLLRRIVTNDRLCDYFIILGCVFSVLIPQAAKIIKIFSPSDGAWLETIVNKAHLHLVLGFSVYYVLGYRLSTARLSARAETVLIAAGFAGFLITLGMTALVSVRQGSGDQSFFGELTANVMLQAVGMYLLFRRVFGRRGFGRRTIRTVRLLSECSFGAYLVHIFVLRGLKAFAVFARAAPAFSIPLVTSACFVLSFGIAALLRRVPYLRRFV